jgi:hypothetical protein
VQKLPVEWNIVHTGNQQHASNSDQQTWEAAVLFMTYE